MDDHAEHALSRMLAREDDGRNLYAPELEQHHKSCFRYEHGPSINNDADTYI